MIRLLLTSAAVFVLLGSGAHAAYAATIRVATLADNNIQEGACSLREAMDNAQRAVRFWPDCSAGDVGVDTIQFDVTGTITLSSPLPAVAAPLVIDGSAGQITISGGGAYRIFETFPLGSNPALDLRDLTLSGGYTSGTGAAVTGGNLTLTDVTLRDNHADGGGGAISTTGSVSISGGTITGNSSPLHSGGAIDSSGSLTVSGATITGNSAFESGGAIYSIGTVTIDGSTISGNSVNLDGGAIAASSLNVTDTTIKSNSAGRNGGAINAGGTVTIDGSTITGNTANQHGGAIASTGLLTITGGTISGNSASLDGGAIAAGPLDVTDTTITFNSAGRSGGAVNASGTVTLDGGRVSGNSAEGDGGAIAAGAVNATDATIVSNSAGGGGGGIAAGTVNLIHTTVSSNTAATAGGAVKASANLSVDRSTMASNTAVAGDGGAIDASGGFLAIARSTFSANVSGASGGALALRDNVLVAQITNSTFANNFANSLGGAVLATSPMTISASTFAHNAAAAGGNLFGLTMTLRGTLLAAGRIGGNCSIDLVDDGGNIADDGSCFFNSADSLNDTDPGLATTVPASNGGPTQTIALAPGSRAIDLVPPASCTSATAAALTIDERGFARLSDANGDGVARCDAGAYEVTTAHPAELQAGPTFTVTTTAPSHDDFCYQAASGGCSLRDAIMMANAFALQRPGRTGTVQLATGATYTLSAVDNTAAEGGNALPVVLGKVTVLAAGSTIQRAANAPAMRLLEVAPGGRLLVQDAILAGGNATGASFAANSGGAVYNLGALTLRETYAHDNHAGYFGGALYNGNSATIDATTLSANTAGTLGGAVMNHGPLRVSNSTITRNSAEGGGAISSDRGKITLTNATLTFDTATQVGPEVEVTKGSISFVNTIVGRVVGASVCSFGGGVTHSDGGHNIDSGTSCGFSTANGSKNSIGPGLGALGDYGGPTPTVKVAKTSPAINAGDNAVCLAAPINNVDQRGRDRITSVDVTCDIGAVEFS